MKGQIVLSNWHDLPSKVFTYSLKRRKQPGCQHEWLARAGTNLLECRKKMLVQETYHDVFRYLRTF